MKTTFNVSNTDVITMLMVKQVAVLEKEEKELRADLKKILSNLETKVKEEYNLQVAKIKPEIINSFKTIVQAVNPKLKFTVQIGHHQFYIEPRNYSDGIFKYQDRDVEISAEFSEEDEAKVICITDHGDLSINIPHKIDISIKIDKEYYTIKDKLDNVSNLLRNKNTLRDKLVAQVTEKALAKLPEMDYLVEDIKLLS